MSFCSKSSIVKINLIERFRLSLGFNSLWKGSNEKKTYLVVSQEIKILLSYSFLIDILFSNSIFSSFSNCLFSNK